LKPFLDTSILIYAQTSGEKGDRAREIISKGGVISIQVLNEFTNVLHKELKRTWPEIAEAIADIETILPRAIPLTTDHHKIAMQIANRYTLSFYDSLILAAASIAGCNIVWTEDLQHGMQIEQMKIVNPFHGFERPMI
jgi:predicted nucleic acid-binding protein